MPSHHSSDKIASHTFSSFRDCCSFNRCSFNRCYHKLKLNKSKIKIKTIRSENKKGRRISFVRQRINANDIDRFKMSEICTQAASVRTV